MANKNKSWKTTASVVGALVLANAFWGGSAVVYQIGLQNMHVLVLSFYRQLFASVVLIMIAAGVERKMPPRSEWGWLALVGFLGVYLNQLLFAIGVFYAQSIIAAIMQLAVSPTTTAMAILLKQEKFSILKLVGIILCIIGSLFMIDISHFSITSGKGLGVVVLFAQSIFAAGYLVAQKQVLERVPPITTTAAMYAVGTPLMTVTALIFLPLNSATWTTNTTGIWAIVYAVAAQSVAAYILNAYANKHSKSSTVAVFETVNPFVAAILATIFLNEPITWNIIVGGLIILGGLAVVTFEQYRETKNAVSSLDALMARSTDFEMETNQLDSDEEVDDELEPSNEYAALSTQLSDSAALGASEMSPGSSIALELDRSDNTT
eukprot:TRINITY_DN6031_c0_g1_i1.p1 TRINITY_DN6031_c0_g1~~TRINITY_DN6031_c0_g1_i1.p1  ORF type:complete len:378 (+),score=55.79 TRINITY_DN6031_c0_g1_i1:92-1225(+)